MRRRGRGRGLQLLDLRFPGGLQPGIDFADVRQEMLHRGQQLLLQPRDLLLAVGLIDPATAKGLAWWVRRIKISAF